MKQLSEAERQEMQGMIKKLREVAEPIGPLHGNWDLIFDLEAVLKGTETFFNWSPLKYLEYARKGFIK